MSHSVLFTQYCQLFITERPVFLVTLPSQHPFCLGKNIVQAANKRRELTLQHPRRMGSWESSASSNKEKEGKIPYVLQSGEKLCLSTFLLTLLTLYQLLSFSMFLLYRFGPLFMKLCQSRTGRVNFYLSCVLALLSIWEAHCGGTDYF